MPVSEGIEPEACEYAIGKITDGGLFENFALSFLSRERGFEFIPVGGIHDRGIDGLEHTFEAKGIARTVYQLSIEHDARDKLRKTLAALDKHQIPVTRLFYVTNQRVPNKDVLIDDFFNNTGANIVIWDLGWFVSHVNDSPGTVQTYLTFIDSYFHQFNKPGVSYQIADLDGDPRLFVFLRQLFDDYGNTVSLTDLLADALILFSLEGTDPDKDIMLTRDEILAKIAEYIRFDPRHIEPAIDRRLAVLSTKPRKINHHRRRTAYVLRYEIRLQIQNRNLADLALAEDFKSQTEATIARYLKAPWTVAEAYRLIEEVIHQVFRQQGLEFANFILQAEAAGALDKSIPDIISSVVDAHASGSGKHSDLKPSLLLTFRELVYSASPRQKEFLSRLSRTYMMLFLLQCDPQLSTFFSSLMSQLRIYVDTSILIPAMSEAYLDPQNQRYTNLLQGARNAGAKLRVNETIVHELAAHMHIVIRRYEEEYANFEDVYDDEPQILYIPEILLRAYFYSKMKRVIATFSQFIETFLSPGLGNFDAQLISWLRDDFGIEFVADDSLGLNINASELAKLTDVLEGMKSDHVKALNDARLVLTIYGLRGKDNEAGQGGITGIRTWWLSTDTTTERAVRQVFPERHRESCYIRSDFLNSFVALAPTRDVIDKTFKEMFPGLVGVSVSYHLPAGVPEEATRFVRDHAQLTANQRKRILRNLVEKLKTDNKISGRAQVRNYFDEELKKLTTGR